jgi:hypothetical protein
LPSGACRTVSRSTIERAPDHAPLKIGVLVLQGPRAEDAMRSAVVQALLKRYGLKTVATRHFKLLAEPREREQGNPLLLTGDVDHDVIWVVDRDGEFARTLPYCTAPPRLGCVGSHQSRAASRVGRQTRSAAARRLCS